MIQTNSQPKFHESGVYNVLFGNNVEVVKPVNLYGCKIGNDSFIGPFVEIQRGVNIGENTKIHSHSFICELVTIGSNCSIAHGVVFINDLFKTGKPADGDKSLWKSTVIADHVSIGSNSTILPVSICSYVVIGAGSVVTRDINIPGIYLGNPARFIRGID